jgi:hypothetical protein
LYIYICKKNTCVKSEPNKKGGRLAVGVTEGHRSTGQTKYQHRELLPPLVATPG